jgi:hypothetical protein
MVDIYKVHFLKSKKKGRIHFPIVMGGYAINDRKGAKEATQILEKLSFPQDQPWRYDPHFVIATEKGKKKPGPQDHEHRPMEQRLANKE